ncbi:MAG: carboxypeptidase-like regulatory domain-containing protein [Allobranchiibius sp.]
MPSRPRLAVMRSGRAAQLSVVVVLALAVAGCASGRASVQSSGGVSGTVLSGPRCGGPVSPASPCPPGPVPGAAVLALNRGHVTSSTRTDARGDFRLTLPVGTYSIQATNIGEYRSTATQTVTVTGSHPVTVTLLLDTGIR